MTYTIVIDGPDADQALAELRSNIEYDDLAVRLTVTAGWAGSEAEAREYDAALTRAAITPSGRK